MDAKNQQKSLSQKAYEHFRKKIVSLELPPGTILDEASLREELGLGRTPIREALQRLSLEKLVNIVPRRGTFVTDIRITDLRQLFEVRLVLESLAARLAAQRGTAEHWQRMQTLLASLPGQTDTVDNETLIAIDEACHQIIYEAAENDYLKNTLTTLYAHSMRLWYFFLARIGHMQAAILEHQQILDALQAGDTSRVSRLMEQHLRAFQEEIQAVMLGVEG